METRVSSHVGFEWYPISSMSSRGILQNAPITQRGSPGNSEIDDHESPSLTIPLWCPLPSNRILVTIGSTASVRLTSPVSARTRRYVLTDNHIVAHQCGSQGLDLRNNRNYRNHRITLKFGWATHSPTCFGASTCQKHPWLPPGHYPVTLVMLATGQLPRVLGTASNRWYNRNELHIWKTKNIAFSHVRWFTAYHLPYFWNLDRPRSSWLQNPERLYPFPLIPTVLLVSNVVIPRNLWWFFSRHHELITVIGIQWT
jgi:hypothetical protein